MKIESVPPEAWIGLLGVFIGALLSVFGVWLSNKSTLKHLKFQLDHESDIRSKSLQRERFEELYVLVEHWLNGLSGVYMSLSMVMQGKIDYSQHLDYVIENAGSSSHDFQRLEMIINIHGLAIKSNYDSVIEARAILNQVSTEHKHDYEIGNIDGSKYIEPYVAAQVLVERRGEVFLKAIANAARIA